MAQQNYIPSGGPLWDFPVKADEVFAHGDGVMCVDTEGYVEIPSNHANGMMVGVAVEEVDATDAASGDKKVRVDIGGPLMLVTYAPGSLDETFIGDRVYFTGVRTVDVAGTATNLVYGGKIVGIVSATKCWIQLPRFDNAGIGVNDQS